MNTVLLISLFCILLLVLIWIRNSILKSLSNNDGSDITALGENLKRIETNLKEDFRNNREESSTIAKENREELNKTLNGFRNELTENLKTILEQNQIALDKVNKTLEERLTALIDKTEGNFKEFNINNTAQLEKIEKQVEQKLQGLTEQDKIDNNLMRESLIKSFKDFQDTFDKNVKSFNDLQREKFGQLEEKQSKLVEMTEKKLEEMRHTVDEKLQKTLNERINQSFELVGKQLESVHKGLGDMQNLTNKVGDLNKIMSNVKSRGVMGEYQLQNLLEDLLTNEQYERNVKTKAGSGAIVEFAIKMPYGNNMEKKLWLPIDSKFPKEDYESLQDAFEKGDVEKMEEFRKAFVRSLKRNAQDIREKYIDPPNTTDFAIMFLPFESIFGEVLKTPGLFEQLQKEYKITVTGPTTLSALLNSLQMGFRTLAIQKRSSEVWEVLKAVKTEFQNFSGLMEKAQKNIQTGLNQLDDVMGKRTKAIQRKLQGVETLNAAEPTLLPLQESTIEELTDDDN